jgi:probable HAF family extracellular repeat protein
MYRKTVLIAALLASARFASAQMYTITDLGIPSGYTRSWAVDVNASGQVAVNADSGSETSNHAFYWQSGSLTNIPGFGLSETGRNRVYGLNDNGSFVGASWDGSGTPHGFHYDAAADVYQTHDYSVTENNYAMRVTNSEEILGAATDWGAGSWIYNGGSVYQVDPTVPALSLVHDLNNDGLILAWNGTASAYYVYDSLNPGTASPGFIWQSDLSHGFRTLSDSGLIAGSDGTNLTFYNLADGFDADVTNLGTFGSGIDAANDINFGGQIVGDYRGATGATFAFLHTGSGFLDLTSAIDPSLGWTLSVANGINDQGQIVGAGWTARGEYHAYLLTPAAVPEPSTYALAGAGLLAVAALLRRQSRRA